MKRRFLSALLTLAIVLSLFTLYAPVAGAVAYNGHFGGYDTELADLKWELDTVTGLLEIKWEGDPLTFPSIPNFSATNAPWRPNQTSIRTLILHPNITGIGNNAFNGGKNLRTVSAPGVETIGEGAFDGCENLTVINMPKVEVIKDSAFRGCASLVAIELPDSLSEIGYGVFVKCNKLTYFSFPGGALRNANFFIDGYGVLFELDELDDPIRLIKAPTGISPYPATAFPDTVITIEPEAFAFSNLTTITIPASVMYIGKDAFYSSVNLKTAVFEGNAPLDTLPWGRELFTKVATGFEIFYYPYAEGWPPPPLTAWRGYTAYAKESYVEINQRSVILGVGRTTQLQATVRPTNAVQTVEWESSDDDIATVSVGGVVHGVSPGEAFITATAEGGNSQFSRIQVLERVVPVDSVYLDQPRITITIGEVLPILTAIVYPADATNKKLVWSSSNTDVAYTHVIGGVDAGFQRVVVPVTPGTATITVRTEDGSKTATCIVTVLEEPKFIPVSNISIATTTMASGATINLGAVIHPANATNAFMRVEGVVTDIPNIAWSIVTEESTVGAIITNGITEHPGGVLTADLGQTGRIVVEATVSRGITDDINYTQRFTINVVSFMPVINITDVPDLGFAGVPLQLSGTVVPVGASYQNIEWSMGTVNTAGAYLDTEKGVLLAQWPGTVSVIATIQNGRISGPTLIDYSHTFSIRFNDYTINRLDLRANPGGTVSGAGGISYAGGEKISISANPSLGYVFAGWHSSNGGEFENPNSTVTQFTMPGNETTVTAFFTFVGVSAGSGGGLGGGVVLPTPVHYFTSTSVYTRNSGVSFGHVTIRDFNLFSHVSLDGRTLSRNAHYTANRMGGFTEIILSNGYLDTLNQGPHTLTVHFRDNVSVAAVFSVLLQVQTAQIYEDVYPSNWFSGSVGYVSDRGWMTSQPTEPRLFRPNNPVTQGEVIEAFYRMVGSPSVLNSHGQPLQGRQAAHEWVRENGIIPLGGVYSLDSPITRQDTALLLGRLVSVMRLSYPTTRPAPVFSDEWQIDAAARGAVVSLFRAEIMSGRTASTFVPLGHMTRAEYATTLHRFAVLIGRW